MAEPDVRSVARDEAGKVGPRVVDEWVKRPSPFLVVDAKTGERMDDFFVLFPVTDSASRVALAAYAEATNNMGIKKYIGGWLGWIHRNRFIKKITSCAKP